MRPILSAAMLAAAFAALPADAAITFFATGTVNGSSAGVGADLSGLTGTLENGLPANVLGGMGSGLAYAGGNTFIAVPDRGPNANPYNSKVDDTVSYISRFHTLTIDLTANNSGSGLPFTLSPTLTKTTLLSSPSQLNYGTGTAYNLPNGAPSQNSAGTYYFTGRSDNFAGTGSGNPDNARFDPESVRVSNDGKSVFISDEYGPYVRQFDRETGKLVKTFTLPTNLDVTTLSPEGKKETAANTSGRTDNKGMEGLAITPDGKTLVGIMQAALIQDKANGGSKLVRIVTIDIATGITHEYGYKLTSGSGVSDIVAINDHEFLIDERDGAGMGGDPVPNGGVIKQLYRIDISGAQDITGLTGTAAQNAAVGKTLFLDVAAQLRGALGLNDAQIPSKIEGISFGQDVTYNGGLYHTLYVANDNDFTPNVSGPNSFYVFGFQDSDLPRFEAQQIAGVPEPASWAMMVGGFGLIGAAMRRRRVAVRFA